jgi:Ala-tRNA(Pro) deacylase
LDCRDNGSRTAAARYCASAARSVVLLRTGALREKAPSGPPVLVPLLGGRGNPTNSPPPAQISATTFRSDGARHGFCFSFRQGEKPHDESRCAMIDVKQYLDDHSVPYEVVKHRAAFDAAHLAHAAHLPGRMVAKTVLLHVNHGFADVVAVLPANSRVDMEKARQMLGGAEMALASEQDVAARCPDCELGVLPPFGSQYGMRTIVDESLQHSEDVLFEAYSHDEAIRMKLADFLRLENPLVGHFAVTS